MQDIRRCLDTGSYETLCTYVLMSRETGIFYHFGLITIQVVWKNKKKVDGTGRQIVWCKTEKMHNIGDRGPTLIFITSLSQVLLQKTLYKCVMRTLVCPECLMVSMKVISRVQRTNDSLRIMQEVSQPGQLSSGLFRDYP